MAHGGGGTLMHQLLEGVFGKAFSNPILDTRHDSAQFTVPGGKLAMTTDSYDSFRIDTTWMDFSQSD